MQNSSVLYTRKTYLFVPQNIALGDEKLYFYTIYKNYYFHHDIHPYLLHRFKLRYLCENNNNIFIGSMYMYYQRKKANVRKIKKKSMKNFFQHVNRFSEQQ